MIYFIQAGEGGPIKIGYSRRSVADRMRTLQTASTAKLRLLAAMVGALKDEAKLHRKFSDLRISGEWFTPAESLLSFIAFLPPDLSGSLSEVTQKEKPEPTHPIDRDGFLSRQSAALAKRIGPKLVTAAEIASAIGVDVDTIRNWRAGKTVMDGDSIGAADLYLAEHGQSGFFAELFRPSIDLRLEGATRLEEKAAELRANAELMGRAA